MDNHVFAFERSVKSHLVVWDAVSGVNSQRKFFVILNHSGRQLVHFVVTAHPTIAWVIQQLREAMPFGQQPTYLFPDNDGIYGDEVSRFLVGTRIEEVKTAHRCPGQNPFVERYGGTLRRELVGHVIVLNEGHLKRLPKDFIEEYYHLARPHQGLNDDTPVPSAKPESAADASRLVSIPMVGGLHHRYIRVSGSLISYSTKRPQNEMKTTHRDDQKCG